MTFYGGLSSRHQALPPAIARDIRPGRVMRANSRPIFKVISNCTSGSSRQRHECAERSSHPDSSVQSPATFRGTVSTAILTKLYCVVLIYSHTFDTAPNSKVIESDVRPGTLSLDVE